MNQEDMELLADHNRRVNSPLTTEEHAAVTAYANSHGRNWRAALRREWERGTANAMLMSLRNARGPLWLQVVVL